MPQISVIVPVYKVEEYLRRCVDSILSQTFHDFELILVDDGSPDNCGKICDQYADIDSRVVVIHQENRGLSGARNAGIDWAFDNSDSEWLTFVDSDDWISVEYLNALLKSVLYWQTPIACTEYIRVSADDLTPELLSCESKLVNAEEFFTDKNITATIAVGKLYKKILFSDIRYPEGKLHEDEYTTYRILFSFDKLAYIATPLYYYYINPQGIMMNWSIDRLTMFTAFEEQIDYFETRGFYEAKRFVIRKYLQKVSTMLKDNSYDNNVKKFLSEKKRKKFKQYAKQLDKKHQLDGWVLTQIYPLRMAFYWRCVALKNKICEIYKIMKR